MIQFSFLNFLVSGFNILPIESFLLLAGMASHGRLLSFCRSRLVMKFFQLFLWCQHYDGSATVVVSLAVSLVFVSSLGESLFAISGDAHGDHPKFAEERVHILCGLLASPRLPEKMFPCERSP